MTSDPTWRDAAKHAGAEPAFVWVTVRKQWPHNDRFRRPDRPSDLDVIWADPELRHRIADVIEATERGTA